MQKTKIETISRSKTKDYGEELKHSFWLKRNSNPQPPFYDDTLTIESIKSLFEKEDSIICVQTEMLDYTDIWKSIFDAARKNNRIYILSKEKPTNMPKDIVGTCLLRYETTTSNIGSFIVVNPQSPNPEGIIITAPLTEKYLKENPLFLNLNKNQIQSLFNFFCYNFWNASYEIKDSYESHQTKPIIEFYYPPKNNFCDDQYVLEELKKLRHKLICTLPKFTDTYINLSELSDSIIITNFGNHQEKLLQDLASKQNTILSYQNPPPIRTILLTEQNKGWIIPKSILSPNDKLWALPLNNEQYNFIYQLMQNYIQNANYEYFLKEKRGSLANKVIYLASNLKELNIREKGTNKADKVICSKLYPYDEFISQTPVLNDDGISISITYEWQIEPFYLPSKAEKHSIYSEWDKILNQLNNIYNKLEEDIKKNNNSNKSIIENIYNRIKSFLLVKNVNFSELNNRLSELKEKKIQYMDAKSRENYIKDLNEIKAKIYQNIKEIEHEKQIAEIDANIEKLNQDKANRNKELNDFIEYNEKNIKILEDVIKEKENDICKRFSYSNSKKVLIKDDFKKRKIRYEKIIEQIDKTKNLDEITGCRKKIREDAEEFLKQYKTYLEMKSNLKITLNKYHDEKKSKKKEIEKLEDKILSKEKEKVKNQLNETPQESSLNELLNINLSKKK